MHALHGPGITMYHGLAVTSSIMKQINNMELKKES